MASPMGNLMTLLAAQGRAHEALAAQRALEVILGIEQSEIRNIMLLGIADPGRRAEAIAEIDRAGRDFEAQVSLGQRSFYYAGLGLLDRAFAVVDTLLTLRDEQMIFAHGQLLFKPMRSDPRWASVSRRMGIN